MFPKKSAPAGIHKASGDESYLPRFVELLSEEFSQNPIARLLLGLGLCILNIILQLKLQHLIYSKCQFCLYCKKKGLNIYAFDTNNISGVGVEFSAFSKNHS